MRTIQALLTAVLLSVSVVGCVAYGPGYHGYDRYHEPHGYYGDYNYNRHCWNCYR